ncbi:hypothetical protein QTP88_001216 [Uroleucon formosanum]
MTEPELEQIFIADTDKVKKAEKLETLDSVVDQPTTESDQLLSTSDMKSAVITQDQIVLVSRDSLLKESQQVIPVTDSALNNYLKLGDNRVDLNQQSVLSMNYSQFNELVVRELSEFSTVEPSQNVRPPVLEMKSKLIKSKYQINIENLEYSLYKVEKADQKEKKNSENDIVDALSTLATAALNQTPPSNGTAKSVISKSVQPIVQINHEEPTWCDVGIIKDTTCSVKQFYSTSTTNEHENTSLNNLPDYSNKLKINIEPETTYKLRIAAINACGRGEWSEITSFKTCLPGYPGVPSAIKITKVPDGARLTWEAPPNTSVNNNVPYQGPKPTPNFNFFRVYCGSHNAALVSNESLGVALIDRTIKPTIIFRITAKNEKGYGPATRVRWLQDNNVPVSNKNPSMKRKNRVNLLTEVPKRPKM